MSVVVEVEPLRLLPSYCNSQELCSNNRRLSPKHSSHSLPKWEGSLTECHNNKGNTNHSNLNTMPNNKGLTLNQPNKVLLPK